MTPVEMANHLNSVNAERWAEPKSCGVFRCPLRSCVESCIIVTLSFGGTLSIVEIFTDLTVWLGIKRIIDRINANAVAA